MDHILPSLPNSTGPAGPAAMTRVYAVSGQYGLLPRILYYSLLAFTVFTHKHLWLVAGAAASAMIFSSSAAIHALILVTLPRSSASALDLDVFATYAASASGLIFIIPILTFSKSLRTQIGRVLVRCWGAIMLAGTACSIAAMWRPWPQEAPCVTEKGALLTSLPQLDVAAFNCSYACFATNDIIRGPTDVTAMSVDLINDNLVKQLFYCALVISFLTCCNLIAYLIFFPQGGIQGAGPKIDGSSSRAWLFMSAAFFSPLMFVANIASTEAFFKASGVPISEEPNLVGQWSTVMGAGLVVVAAAINKWVEYRQIRKEGTSVSAEQQGTMESIQMIDRQYTWEPVNNMAPGNGYSS